METIKNIKIILASPRGFCAGVKRAIEIVEIALEKHGAPIYVRHEIVHNKRVVEDLTKKGAIFVKELEEIPEKSRVIFSAHGVANRIKSKAKKLQHLTLDATCPLVSKVHKQTQNFNKKSYKIVLIGHKGHPEVEGIEGQIDEKLIIIENEEQAKNIDLPKNQKIAYVTQTTLSMNDTKNIINVLKKKFPNIEGPDLDDICYATQNRQSAVSDLAEISDMVFVVGGENSSNTKRLAEIVDKKNVPVYRISGKEEINDEWLIDKKRIGITAGASSPEILIEEIIKYLEVKYKNIEIQSLDGIQENIRFKPLQEFS